MRRAIVLSALLAVVLVACGGDPATDTTTPQTEPAESTETTATTTATSTPAPTTTAPPATTVAPAAPQAEVTTYPGLPPALSRSVIPLDDIDAGWVAVVYSADTNGDTTYVDGPSVLYLVGPSGDLYEVATMGPGTSDPIGEIVGVGNISNSGERITVVVDRYDAESFARVASVDIATGEISELGQIYRWDSSIGSTLPTGRDVVVRQLDDFDTDGRYSLRVYRTDGSLFATIVEGVNSSIDVSWLYGLDGTEVLVGEAGGIFVYSNQGEMLRRLDSTPGSGVNFPAECAPKRWWDQTTVLVACPTFVFPWQYSDLWLAPFDGDINGLERLSPDPNGLEGSPLDIGYSDAWNVGDTVVLQHEPVEGCDGGPYLETLGADGATTIIARGRAYAISESNLVVATNGEQCGPASGGRGGWVGVSDSLLDVVLIGTDGSVVRTLIPHVDGYVGVASVAGMIPVP